MAETNRLGCLMKSYIQPFERTLASMELEILTGYKPVPRSNQNGEPILYYVDSPHDSSYLAERLAYWERVFQDEDISLGEITRQARREATAGLARNGIKLEQFRDVLPFRGQISLTKHRSLRYGPHGIHEYRGKFFPQLVRSLLNISRVTSDSIVLDPMCGSGTTLVEGILLGCRSVGIDLNPLSVLISRAKCNILHANPDQLLNEYRSCQTDLLALSQKESSDLLWFNRLPSENRDYLSRWFSPRVLAQLDPIAVRISNVNHTACRELFQLSLSNILRCVSWQKTDDLRVRKSVASDDAPDVLSEFLTELDRSVRTVLAFIHEDHCFKVGQADIIEGDARDCAHLLTDFQSRVDVIVTSPPYATALPYLDTDRLSLYYLDLLTRSQHRGRDYKMIGNREITNTYRRQYLDEYYQRRNELPQDIVSIIDSIEDLNRVADVGFRRRNLAALLARYFLDMKKVFESFRILLRPGSPAYVVVGNNYTIAGNKRVDIETDQLLAQLGKSVGLHLETTIPMQMLVSRDIFKKNTGSAETILFFVNR